MQSVAGWAHRCHIPQPMPDNSRLPEHHYLSVFDTPTANEDGTPRRADDFNPRAQIRAAFRSGSLTLDCEPAIDEFCTNYGVDKVHVEEYLQHLVHLEWMKNIRAKSRRAQSQAKKEQGYGEYKWTELFEDGTLGKLTVLELNKYLNHHDLPTKGKKRDKVRTIAAHLSQSIVTGPQSIEISEDREEDDPVDEEEEEEVIDVTLSDSEDETLSEDESLCDSESTESGSSTGDSGAEEDSSKCSEPPNRTRSGRTVKTPLSKDYHFY